MEAHFQLIGQQRGWILFHIQKFIYHHRKKILKSCELHEILGLYDSLRSTYQNPNHNRYCLNWALSYIINQTYKSRLEDSEFVFLVLNHLIENDGHVGSLFKLSENATNSCQNPTLLEYFLEHTNRKAVIFGGSRMACAKVYDGFSWVFPLEHAIQLKSLSLMYQLLRYGAVWSHQSYSSHLRPKSIIPVEPSFDITKATLTLIVHSFLIYNPELAAIDDLDDAAIRCDCEKLILLGTLVLRDSSQLRLKMLHKQKIGGRCIQDNQILFSILERLDDVALPGLLRRFMQPLSLKHLSKIEIRKILNNNWQLPGGIYLLQLPQSLENYLDLRCD